MVSIPREGFSDDLPPVNPLVDTLYTCANASVQLTLPPMLTDIQWNTGDTTQSLGVANSGTYWVSALYPNGVVIKDTVEVIQHGSPSSLISTMGSTNLCPGEDVTLSFDTSYVASLIWAPSQDTTSSIVTSIPGSYYVQYSTISGCIGYSDTVEVTSLLAPSAVITLSDSAYFCLGDTLVISAEPGHSYVWSTGEQGASIDVVTSGDYRVEITSPAGCMTQSDTISAVMLPGVVLPVLFTSNAFAANGDTTNFKMIPYNQAFTYTWSVIGGSIIAGQGGENVDILWQSTPGDTAVVKLIVDNGLCVDSTTLKVYITTIGTSESYLDNLKLYPNPATGRLYVEGLNEQSNILICEVIDAMGQKIQIIKLAEERFIDIEMLPAGTYTLRLSDGLSQSVYRFVKIR